MNKSPILGNLTWPLKSTGLALPNSNGFGLKICCNSVASSQTYLSGSSKYQILINNNSNNCAKSHQLTCNNNNMIISNKNFINSSSSPDDNNENILNASNSNLNNHSADYNGSTKSSKVQKSINQSIDAVDCPLIINHHNHFQSSHLSQTTSTHHFGHFEQCATNQQQFSHHSINATGLSGSCSQLNQLNNFSTSNTNLMTNHSVSLSNLTNLSNLKTANQFNSSVQCNCLENENCSWTPKFNTSLYNDAQEPVEILPHLLLGSESHASSLDMLKRIGVTALLNVSHSCPNHFEKDFVYKCIPVQDSSFEDISVYFEDAIQFIGMYRL